MKKNNRYRIPAFASLIIRILKRYRNEYDLEDIIIELYKEKTETGRKIEASMWLWKQVLGSIPGYFSHMIRRSMALSKNYIKIALRSMKRNIGYSVINIFGLALGIACSIFAYLYIADEFSYDKFHDNYQNIYRIVTKASVENLEISDVNTSFMLGEKLRYDYPEIETVAMFAEDYYRILEADGSMYNKEKIIFADQYFFELFSFMLIQGNPVTALSNPNTAIITESTARRLFGEKESLGQVIRVDSRFYSITGVLEDIPGNSHIDFDIALSLITAEEEYRNYGWKSKTIKNYFLMKENGSVRQLDNKLDAVIDEHIKPGWNGEYDYVIQSLKDIHLHSHMNWNEFQENGRIEYIYILSVSAAFILLIACVNFINLSTARSAKRSLEVGIRKIAGSRRSQLIRQFIGESTIISLHALVLAVIILEVILKMSGSLIGKQLEIGYFDNYYFIPGLILLTAITGIISGSYPAFYISSVRPVSAIKGRFNILTDNRKVSLRNCLVVFQFSISILFLISTLVIYNQLQYFKNKDLGFNKEQVLVIKNARLLKGQYNSFKEELRSYPDINFVSSSYAFPGTGSTMWKFEPEGKEGTRMITYISDYHFVNTLGLKIIKGRFFSKDHPADQLAVVVNEKTVRSMDWREPLGQFLTVRGKKLKVVGVVKDFHDKSLHSEVEQLAILFHRQFYPEYTPTYIGIRIRPHNISKTIDDIRDRWDEATMGVPLDYSFLDEDFERFYRSEERMGRITVICSLISILIASMGLFGLTAFIIEQKTKELGIRKVLGASKLKLLSLMTNDFIVLLIIANILAMPIAGYFMSSWLQQFAYRIEMNLVLFATGGLISFLIAIISISILVMKAASKNPIDSLRYE